MTILRAATTEGAAKGIVTVRAPHELNDNEVVWLQDALVNQAGLIVRRNGLPASGTFRKTITTDASSVAAPLYVISGYNPIGQYRIMVIWGNTTSSGRLFGTIYDSSFTLISRQFLCFGAFTNAQNNIQCSVLPDGGVKIWGSAISGSGPTAFGPQALAADYCVWYGAGPPIDYGVPGTTTATVTVAVNSVTVTASVADVAKMAPGTIIQNVGVVRSVESTTTVTLMKAYHGAALVAVAKALYATMIPWPIRSRGMVSTTVSGNIIVGYGTNFNNITDTSKLFNTPCTMWRQDDGSLLANLRPVAATTATTGLSSVTVAQDSALIPYFCTPDTSATVGVGLFGSTSSSTAINNSQATLRFGGLTASYKGYTLWANGPTYGGTASATTDLPHSAETNRVWITGPNHPFECDHGPDGTWFDVPGQEQGDTDILAIGTTSGGVVICKRRSVWLLSGDDPDTFVLNKIHDDGVFGPTSITGYQQGVIWANRSGIWYFDGSSAPLNLIKDTILNLWSSMTQSFNAEGNNGSGDASQLADIFRMFVHRDHLFIYNGHTTLNAGYSLYNGKTATASNSSTLVMYLPNRACNFWTNFDVLGFLPPSPGNPAGYVLMSDANGGPYYLVNLDSVMDPAGTGAPVINDNFTTSRSALANTPCFYMETKKYDLGDALNRKVFRGLVMESKFTNAALTAQIKLDYVLGLNSTGVTTSTSFPDTLGVYKAQRIKFRARDQFIGYRIYEDTSNRSTQVTIAPWQLLYKPGRPGNV